MSSIRPVTRRFPSSQDVWEDSNLPFSLVVTPLADPPSSSTPQPPLLTGIAKCLQCGAPHPTRTTHYHSRIESSMICYLCGKTSSTQRDQQQQARQAAEEEEMKEVDHNQETTCQDEEKTTTTPTTFRLPLRISTTTLSPLYSIPAMACPTLWFIVLDATCHLRKYWSTVSRLLQNIDMPPHVHVSILLATSASIGIYQLSSPIPHVVQFNISNNNNLSDAILSSLVPADGQSHLRAAIRSLMDYTCNTTSSSGMGLGLVVEHILMGLQERAQPAGQRNATTTNLLLPYAGGKITCWIANRPAGLSDRTRPSKYHTKTNHNSTTCQAGRISNTQVGQRFGSVEHGCDSLDTATDVESGNIAAHLPTSGDSSNDLTAQDLWEHYEPTQESVEQYYAELGQQCAQAAMGVDLLLLVENEGDDHDFGLPLFANLADKSGAPAPVILDYSNDTNVEQQLQTELLSRTPWQPNQVFGAELRLRLSPGFTVDRTPVERVHDIPGPQLAPLYTEAGLMGPACAVEDATHLWRMGTCDSYTSLTIDLAVQRRHIQNTFAVDGFGEVTLKPVIQTCFAYTTVVRDDEKGDYTTVRQMRIASMPVPFANSVESLYASLDPEALAVVLFHKLALASLQDGLSETPVIAQNWLQSLLACAYRSAEEEAALQEEYQAKGIEPKTPFYANERLLDREGELSAEEVLLAQGHERLRPIPLMVYLLLQCDALRASRGSYRPSLDLRSAALSQMACMTPTILTRCIAPRLQLWASGDDQDGPILDIIDLRSEAVQLAIMEYGESSHKDLMIFLDSPDQIVVMDARYINASASTKSSKHKKLVVGSALKEAIAEAAQSYRTPPPIVYELNQTDTSGEQTLFRLMDALIEDAPSPTGHENFSQWRSEIASSVHADLETA